MASESAAAPASVAYKEDVPVESVLLVNSCSCRRLYAQEGKEGRAGFGACDEFLKVFPDQVWQKRVCVDDAAHECVTFCNESSKRFLHLQKEEVMATTDVEKAESLWRLKPDGDGKLLVHRDSKRRLAAQKKRKYEDGVLCYAGDMFADQRWYVVPVLPRPELQLASLLLKARLLPGWQLCVDEDFKDGSLPLWKKEEGWVRNSEDQYYHTHESYAQCGERGLVIHAKKDREKFTKEKYPGVKRPPKYGGHWTSASLESKFSFTFGLLEVEAKIDARFGFWPAIWTTGATDVDCCSWPHSGEIDVMEYYQDKILANVFWGQHPHGHPNRWNPASATNGWKVTEWDEGFFNAYHTWRMLWLWDRLEVYLDERQLFSYELEKFKNPSGTNPFRLPQRLRLNLAVGGQAGGKPDDSFDSSCFEVRAVRLWCDPHFFNS
mmetsp:Transcript_44921/g.80968  ORF Transcript_44921/g.80968 Transcript_44921/m.80968 type:complete len:435 (-) Transcript_44921:33-1337(-)